MEREISVTTILLYIAVILVVGFLVVKCIGLKNDVNVVSDELRKQYNIDTCLTQAQENYDLVWFGHCKSIGAEITNGSCLLPANAGKEYNDRLAEDKKLCIERYAK